MNRTTSNVRALCDRFGISVNVDTVVNVLGGAESTEAFGGHVAEFAIGTHKVWAPRAVGGAEIFGFVAGGVGHDHGVVHPSFSSGGCSLGRLTWTACQFPSPIVSLHLQIHGFGQRTPPADKVSRETIPNGMMLAAI